MANKFKNEEFVHIDRSEKQEYKIIIAWHNVFLVSLLHLGMFYGFYLAFTSANWKTALFGLIVEEVTYLGLCVGKHRLWAHRTYEANWPLRVFLCLLDTILLQGDIYAWSRDHRAHHKFTATDADPYNIKRGFFFAHIGWLLCRKHPDVIKKGRTIPFDDLWSDPIVRFQRRFYIPLVVIFSFCLPTMIPVWCWGETVWNSFFIAALARIGLGTNIIFSLNSIAHKYGDRPYDKREESVDSYFMALLTKGEGWHNYHHAFPWVYTTNDLNYSFSLVEFIIYALSKIGLAYNLKTVNSKTVEAMKRKYGDDTRANLSN